MGHQVCTWGAGRVLADLLGVRFAHSPIAEPWESHLNLGSGEVFARDLRATARTVRVPPFRYQSAPLNEVDHNELAQVVRGHQTNSGTVFRLALNQSWYDLNSMGPVLREKYWVGRHRAIHSGGIRIAVHVRRGDVSDMRQAGHHRWAARWLNIGYFETLLNVIDDAIGNRAREVVVVSEGNPSDFSSLVKSFGAELVLGGDPTVAFDRLVDCDVLIASPSRFSFIAGLVSDSITLFPAPWWHAVPEDFRWIHTARDFAGFETDFRERLGLLTGSRAG